jgi:hypothetical protein
MTFFFAFPSAAKAPAANSSDTAIHLEMRFNMRA